MPGIEPGASYMQSMRSTTELHPLTFVLAKFGLPINLFHFFIEQAGFKSKIMSFTRGETRTRNLRFRRPTPYPLGHAGFDNVQNMFKLLHINWECHPIEILHIRELQWASWFRSLESFSKGLCKSKGALLPLVVQSTALIILFRLSFQDFVFNNNNFFPLKKFIQYNDSRMLQVKCEYEISGLLQLFTFYIRF